MKLSLYLLLLIVLTIEFSSAKAQDLNYDFETWHSVVHTQTGKDPDGWRSSNEPLGFTASPIIRSTDKHSGNYAAELNLYSKDITSVILCNGTPKLIPSTDSWYKVIDIPSGGTPISNKPPSLKGYYKWRPDNSSGDSAYALVLLKKYNLEKHKIDTIAIGKKYLSESTTFTSFEVPINYLDVNVQPDSVVIAFVLNGHISSKRDTTGVLKVDNIYLETNVGISSSKLNNNSLGIYPNPCHDGKLFLRSESMVNSITVNSIDGRLIKNISSESLSVDVSDLKRGMYFITLENSEGKKKTHNLIIQ